MLQEWETPVMWFAFMWASVRAIDPSLSHTTYPGSTMVFTKHHYELDLVIQILQVSSYSVVSYSYSSL